MEKQLQKILDFRYKIESSNASITTLFLCIDESELHSFIHSLHKAFTGSLLPPRNLEIAKESFPSYEKSELHPSLRLIAGLSSIFQCRAIRFASESLIKYYASRYSVKTISDIITFNLLPEDRPNSLVILFNGLKEIPDLYRYKICIEEFKSAGIIYPRIVFMNFPEDHDKDCIIERLSIELRISRSCIYFISNYQSNEWQSNLKKDYNILQFLADLVY